MYLSNNVWTFFVIVVLSNVIDVQDTLSLEYHVDSCDAWIFQTSNASASFKSERLRGIELKSVNEYLNSIKIFQNHLGRLFLKTSCQSDFNKYEFSSKSVRSGVHRWFALYWTFSSSEIYFVKNKIFCHAPSNFFSTDHNCNKSIQVISYISATALWM